MGDQWLFVSDAHLTPGDTARQGELARFLLDFPGLTHLCINGDLLDFFFGFRSREMAGFDTILTALGGLTARGVTLHYVEGNHDFCLGSRFAARYGAQIHPEGTALTLGDQQVWVEHGDRANPEEHLEHLFRWLFRTRAAHLLAELVGPAPLQRFGRWLDRATTGAHYTTRDTAHPCFRDYAARRIGAGYDVVILGHAHVPGDETVERDGRRGRYLNSGDWLAHRSYITWDAAAGFQLHNGGRRDKAPPPSTPPPQASERG